jgi:hypothetical protein
MLPKPFTLRRKIRLSGWRDIRNEIARVYKAAVLQQIEWQDATRAAHILNILAAIDQGSGVNERLARLEASLAARPNGHDTRSELRA